MLNKTRRAKRMEKNHIRRKPPILNLVSLMDIFTILVFFLLISSSNVHQLPKKKDINLPTSIATKVPKETIIIAVTQTSILVQGQEVALVSQIMSNAQPIISLLQNELSFHASKTAIRGPASEKKGLSVTIMGDEEIPYDLLKKILATCRQSNYTQIAFAVIQKAPSGENE